MWRFAMVGGGAALLAGTLAGCASGRPELSPPIPRTEPVERDRPVLAPADPIPPSASSTVTGDIRFTRPPGSVELGPTIVTLRPRHGPAAPPTSRAPTTLIVSREPEFAPELRVVRPDQPVIFENRGPLVHRVFSPQLGERTFPLPPGGRADSWSSRVRGPIRFYCSLHPGERFLVLVEDAPFVALVDRSGGYTFSSLPAGRYVLSIWSERVSGPVREVVVDGFTRSIEPIWLDPALIER